jgi:Ca2+/Na+ antiporter
MSAYQGNPDIALGNAYGSNIGNIGLILGMSILLKPMFINVNLLKRELVMLILILILTHRNQEVTHDQALEILPIDTSLVYLILGLVRLKSILRLFMNLWMTLLLTLMMLPIGGNLLA